jgi:hypothetical protein
MIIRIAELCRHDKSLPLGREANSDFSAALYTRHRPRLQGRDCSRQSPAFPPLHMARIAPAILLHSCHPWWSDAGGSAKQEPEPRARRCWWTYSRVARSRRSRSSMPGTRCSGGWDPDASGRTQVYADSLVLDSCRRWLSSIPYIQTNSFPASLSFLRCPRDSLASGPWRSRRAGSRRWRAESRPRSRYG